MRLWTFPYRSIPAPRGDVLAKAHFDLAVFLEDTEPDEVLWCSLGGRRKALQQYELESYAAMWREWETQIRCLIEVTDRVLRHVIHGASDA